MSYADFLATKRRVYAGDGLDTAPALPAALFPFQSAITRWALRKGRCAIFADTGLGKSFMQVSWAAALEVPTLLLAPLCVAEQTVAEAAKLGIRIDYAEHKNAIAGPLTITNYERLDRFDPAAFGAVVLDESGILKAFDGKTRTRLIEAFRATRYRLCCTATPAPNDIAELANHAEFLGLMTRAEFLATWFVHDDAGWRMKKHARKPFFRWLASWACAVRTPSDLGFSDDGYILPPLTIQDHTVMASAPPVGMLFHDMAAKGIQGRMAARCASIPDRVAATVEIVRENWVNHVRNIGANTTQKTERADSPTSARPTIGTDLIGWPHRPNGERTKMLSDSQKTASISGSTTSPIATATGSKAERTISPPTESPSRTSSPSLNFRAEDAASAGSDRQPNASSMLTTTMQPEPSAESCATSAISDSANTETAQSGSPLPVASEKWDTCPSRPQWLIWTGLNEEATALARLIPGAVEISGRDSHAEKRAAIRGFQDGSIRVIVSKLRIIGYGLNMQHCHQMLFVGIGDSYEQYYQGVRRCWRFGQTAPVDVTIIVSEAETCVVANVRKKEQAAIEMSRELLSELRDFEREEIAV